MSRVDLALPLSIDQSRRWRDNLHNKCRWPFDSTPAHEMCAATVQVDQIGLDHRVCAENTVKRSIQHLTQSVALDVGPKNIAEVATDPLVPRPWCGGHRKLAVVHLIPAAIIR